MAKLQKKAFLQDLDEIQSFITEEGLLSKYFNITDLPLELPMGKSSMLIMGSPALLDGVILKIELVDSLGIPVYIEPVYNYSESGGVRVGIEVYKDTAAGAATLTILGELDPDRVDENIPDQWRGTYNVKYTRNITINKTIPNDRPIRFFKRPRLQVIEIIKGQVSLAASTTGSNEQAVGTIIGTPVQNTAGSNFSIDGDNYQEVQTYADQVYGFSPMGNYEEYDSTDPRYTVTIADADFSSSMVGGAITIDSPNVNLSFSTGSSTVIPSYTSRISNVINKKTIEVQKPYGVYDSGSGFYRIAELGPSSYKVNWPKFHEYDTSSINFKSFADIRLSKLRNFSGDVHRIAGYVKNNGPFGNWSKIIDTPVESPELLLDPLSITGTSRIGFFNSDTVATTYWTATGGKFGVESATTVQTYSSSEYLTDSIYMSGSNVDLSSDDNEEWIKLQLKDAFKLDFIADTEYKLKIKLVADNTGGQQNTIKAVAHMSGSAFGMSQNNIFAGQGYGRAIGMVTHNNSAGNVMGTASPQYEAIFTPDSDGTAVLQLRFTGGYWSVSEISVKPNSDTNFSPEYIRLIAPVPPLQTRPDYLDFAFEFYDINNNKSQTVITTLPDNPDGVKFDGENMNILGNDNLIGGSVYVGGDSVGAGIQFGGVNSTIPETGGSGATASGFIRSVKYQGFTSASQAGSNTGFMIYSGSVLPDSGDDYSGVGLELVGESGSFRFGTSPSRFEVIADSFFVGSSNAQFISGSSGNIEISSSAFHLTPTGDVIMSGSVTATEGYIGDWKIVDGMISGSNATLDATGAALYKSDAGPDTNPLDGYYIDFTPGSYYVRFGTDFAVSSSGTLIASGAKIEGVLTSSLGLIADWNIAQNTIHYFTDPLYTGLSSTGDTRFFAGATSLTATGSAPFNVKASGDITGSKVLFTGGKIAAFSISDDALYTDSFFISASATNNDLFISASNFNVSAKGDVSASDIYVSGGTTVGGDIIGGGIAGWTISATSIVDDNNIVKLEPAGTYIISSSDFQVSSAGEMTASAGKIAGFEINGTQLKQGTSFFLDGASNGTFFISSSDFQVTPTGQITASEANITGDITANTITATTAGNIANFTVASTGLTSTGVGMHPAGQAHAFTAGTGGTPAFSVTHAGQITASAANITGDIVANTITANTAGTIANFDIDSIEIASSNNKLRLKSSGQITASAAKISGSGVEIAAPSFILDTDNFDINSTIGTVALGTTPTLTGGTGVFMSSSGEFRLGDPSSYLSFVNDAFTLAGSDIEIDVTDLNISASGFTLSSPEASMSLGSSRELLLHATGGTNNVPIIKLDGGEISSSNFFVSTAGEITASGGTIGGWSMTTASIESANKDVQIFADRLTQSDGSGGPGFVIRDQYQNDVVSIVSGSLYEIGAATDEAKNDSFEAIQSGQETDGYHIGTSASPLTVTSWSFSAIGPVSHSITKRTGDSFTQFNKALVGDYTFDVVRPGYLAPIAALSSSNAIVSASYAAAKVSNIDENQYTLIQEVSASSQGTNTWVAGNVISFAFVGKMSHSLAGAGYDRGLESQKYKVDYWATGTSEWKQFIPESTGSDGFGAYDLATRYTSVKSSNQLPENTHKLRIVLSGSINSDIEFKTSEDLYEELKLDPVYKYMKDAGILPEPVTGSAENVKPESAKYPYTELSFDNFRLVQDQPRIQISQAGFLLYQSENSYLKMTPAGMDMRSSNEGGMAFGKSVTGRSAMGGAGVFGRFAAPKLQAYDADPNTIEAYSFAGNTDEYARGNHAHILPFDTVRDVLSGQTLINFTSTGIDDNADQTVITIGDDEHVTFAGNIILSGTVDGVDVLTRDAVLTSTTTTANSAVQPADTFYIGTTSIAHNRGSAGLTLAGITLTTPSIAAAGWENANHTHAGSTTGGQIAASAVSDFDTEVANNTAVAANTLKVSDVNHNVTTNLSVSRNGAKIDVVSSDGTNAVLPLADTDNWGVMSDEMFDEHTANNAKVSDINHNVTTDLSVSRDSTKLDVVSSDGTNAVLPLADTNNWGVMSDEMFDEHEVNNAKASDINHNVTTNLSVSRDSTKLDIVSSDGTNAVLPLADTDNWGVMSDEMFDYLYAIEPSADVTDEDNVRSAGALMDDEVDADIKTLSLPASTTISTFGASLIDDVANSNARTTLGLGTAAITAATAYATSAQGSTADSALQPADTMYVGTTSIAFNRANAALTLAGITLTTPNLGTPSTLVGTNISGTAANLTVGATTGVEAGATADQTAAEILTAIKTVDGAGTGLDADLLDGQHGSYYTDFSNITVSSGEVSNTMLANSSINFGGISLSLGGSDATPAFALADATGLPIVAGTTGTLSVARGGTGVTSKTGTGNVVLSASPTLTGTLAAAAATFGGTISNTGLHTVTQTADHDGIRFRGYDDSNSYYGKIGITDVGYTQIFAEGNRSIDLKSGRQIRFFTSTDNSTYNNSVTFNMDGTSTFTGDVTGTTFIGALTGNVTGNTSGTALTVTQAAQSAITSLGTLTALQVDNLNFNGNTISSTSGVLNIVPLAGQYIALDGTIAIDAGVVTGATSITSTAFVGALTGNVTGNVTGNAGTVTINSDFSGTYPVLVDVGSNAIYNNPSLTYNGTSDTLTSPNFAGALTGNVTGNTSGTALTVTQAAQPAITSVGTLTDLTISGTSTTIGTVTSGIWNAGAVTSTGGVIGSYGSFGYMKTTGNGSIQIGSYAAVKSFAIGFTNGVANQKAQIIFTKFWGEIEISLSGTYSNQNMAGVITKKFGIGVQTGSTYANVSRYTEALGVTADNFAIGEVTWDSTNSRYYIPIVHRVSTGNTCTVRVRWLGGDSTQTSLMDAMSISSVYTTDTTAYTKPVVGYNSDVLIGKTTSNIATGGIELQAGGALWVTKASGNPMALRRNSDDGGILEFYRDATLQGKIGTEGGDIFIGQGDTGIQFADGADAIVPVNGLTGADRNDLISIGGSSNKFKDIHLSGDVNATGATFAGNVATTGTGTITSVSSLTAGGTLYVDENIRHTGDTNNYINFTTDTQRYYTDNTLALTLDSSQNATFAGNIGVQGATPTHGLTVGGIAGQYAASLSGGSSGNHAVLYIANGGGSHTGNAIQIAQANSGKILVATATAGASSFEIGATYNGASPNIISTGGATFGGDIILSEGTNQELSTGNNSLVVKNMGSTTAGGLVLQSSNNTHLMQLYGTATEYGFLGYVWGDWDIKKTVNGRLELNSNSTYYLQPDSLSHFNTFSTAGTSTFAGVTTIDHSGTNSAILNIDNDTAGKAAIHFKDGGVSKAMVGLTGAITGNSTTDIGLFSEAGSGVGLFVNGSGTRVVDINSSGNATFSGQINANGGFERRKDHNTVTSMALSNQDNGTAHHVEMYIKDSVGSLTLGYSNNYSSVQWQGAWVYSSSGPLMLKATNSDVEIFAGGNDDADRALILDTSLNATFAGRILGHAGTAALPSFAFSGDTNTGMYNDGSNDNLKFSTGGVERAFLSATQWNVTGNLIAGGTVTSGLTGTNGYLNFKRSSDGAAVGGVGLSSTNVLDIGVGGGSYPTIRFLTDSTLALSINQSQNATFSGDLTVTGKLNITGDIDSYNVTDLDVVDKTITLGAGQIEANSGGSGIVIDGSSASMLWDESNTEWDFNNSINVTGAGTFSGNINANGNIVGDGSTAMSSMASLGIGTVTATGLLTGVGLTTTGAITATGQTIGSAAITSTGLLTGVGLTTTGAITATGQTIGSAAITSTGLITGVGLTTTGAITATGQTIGSGAITSTGTIAGVAGTFSGAITATTINTGQGVTEVFLMDQNVTQASAPQFAGLTSTEDIVLSGTGDSIYNSYISGIMGSGWKLDYDTSNGGSSLEIDNITVRNTLQTHIFQKDVVKATNGYLYVSDSGVISGSDNNFVYFEDEKSATFASASRLWFKSADITGSGTINSVKFSILSASFDTNQTGVTKYTVDNITGDLANLTVGGTAVRISGGSLLLDASSAHSPFMDVISGSNDGAAQSVVTRTGRLTGITSTRFGELAGYGFWASGSAYLEGTINATSGNIGGWGIGATAISSSNGIIDIDAGAKRITIRSDLTTDRVHLGEIDSAYGLKIFNENGAGDDNLLVELGSEQNMIAGWDLVPGNIESDNATGSVRLSSVSQSLTIWTGSKDEAQPKLVLGKLPLHDGTVDSPYGFAVFNGTGTVSGSEASASVLITANKARLAGWDLVPGSIKSDNTFGSVRLSSIEQALTIWTGSINEAQPKLVLGKLPLNDGTVDSPYGFAVFSGSGTVSGSEANASVLITANKARLAGWNLSPGKLESGTVAVIDGDQAKIALGTNATTHTGMSPSASLFFVSASSNPTFFVGTNFTYVNDVLTAAGWTIGSSAISKGKTKLTSATNASSFAIQDTVGVANPGIFIGQTTDADTYQMSLSGSAGRMLWDNTALKIYGNNGTEVFTTTATGATIGGWSLGVSSFKSSNWSAGSGGELGGGSGEFSSAGIKLHDTGYISSPAFWLDTNGNAKFNGDISAGTGTLGNALSVGSNFSVDSSGNMNASNAKFSGSIKALSGHFAGDVTAGTVTIGAGGITGSSAGGFRMGNEGLIIGGGSITLGSNFSVDSSGNMNAANARFSGSIKALSGTFEGDVTAGTTTINAGGITGSAAGGFRMGNEGLIIGGGSINLASAFIATSTGQVTGSKMLFKGGSIGGWQVAQTYLVDGSNNLKFEPAGTYIISSSMFKVSAAGNITASNMEITQATIRGGTAANWIGHSSYLSFVGGGTYNVITGSSFNSVIGAGAHNMISQSSDFSSILSGMSCSIKGNSDMSFIGAGISNQIISSSNMSFIGSGEGNKILYASQSGIVTGEDNRIEGGIDGPEVSLADAFTSKYSFIGGGISNKIYKGQGNSILSGQENLISGSNWSSSTGVAGDYQSHCTIGGGKQNKIYGQWSYSNIIAGGLLNKMYGDQISDTRQSIFTSTIGGGTFNSMYVGSATGPAIVSSVICGGVLNNINNGVATGFIGGGSANKLTGPGVNYAVIVGGRSNQIIGEGGEYNSILGGYSNEITSTGDYNGILGGYNSGIGSSYTDTFIVGSGINADASNTTFVEALKSKGDITAFWSSDIRLKDNIRPIEGALFKVKQIRGIEFEWNDKLGDRAHQPAGTTDIGVVAQDVQKVLPNIVKEREDGWLGVRYERMIPVLLEAIKEQQTQIETLEARIKNLEGEE